MAGIAADHAQHAVPADDLAFIAHFLDGCPDFHGTNLLFEPVNNSTPREIVRRQFDGNLVSGQNLDEMHSHFSGHVSQHLMTVFKLDLEGGVGQCVFDHAVDFNGLLFRHSIPLGRLSPSMDDLSPLAGHQSPFPGGLSPLAGDPSPFMGDRCPG
jgi:hypothetical protein